VIGSGVLEHVPNDSESLKELYRIIRPGGYFIMNFLPNKYSYTEWMNRRLRNSHHLRLYSLDEARHMFMHHGFLPVRFGYHQMIPSLSNPKNGIFDSPSANRLSKSSSGVIRSSNERGRINRLSTNIFIVGKKVDAFGLILMFSTVSKSLGTSSC
jgi:ubiquinone/menaquinone biosynthesis C-methylase UbiE